MSYAMSIAGGGAVKYKEINFTKRHPNPDCDTFNAIIEWDEAVSLFDRVSITDTGVPTILFEGLVESINCFWDDTERVKRISGRCRKVILWKKFIERFERGDIDGFFRHVSVSKLVRFLLRCPISDAPNSSVFHRIGYGFDLYNGQCSAIGRDPRTHPEWCRVRHSGFCWRLGGCDYVEDRRVTAYTQQQFTIGGCLREREWVHSCDTVVPLGAFEEDYCVDGRSNPWDEDDWTQVGAGDPWLDDCPNDDGDYITAPYTPLGKTQSYFTFQNLPPPMDDFKADRDECQICLRGRLFSGGDGCCSYIDVRVWLWDFTLNNCVGGWLEIGDARFTSCDSWETVCLDIPAEFWHCQDKRSVNECRLKVMTQAAGVPPDGDRGGVDINWAQLHIEGDEIHWNDVDDPWLSLCEDDDWIEGYQTCEWDSYWDFEDIPATPCKDTLGNARAWRELASVGVNLVMSGKNIIVAGAGRSVNVRAYLWDGVAWNDVGSDHIWAIGETSWTLKSEDVSAILNTIAKINAARLRLWFRATGAGTDADWSHPRITCAYLEVDIQESDYQRLCDWFDIDLGASKNRVMGVLIESRYSADRFAVNYEIQTSPDKAAWTTRAGPVVGNSCKDIIESWTPVTCRYVRIHITAPSDNYWEISQVFVWQAEDTAYDIDGITIGNITAPNGGNFHDFGCQVAPQSFGFQRLSEALTAICQTSHSAFVPWEWWIKHNAAHDFCFKAKRGVDRSAQIHIQKGVHIKSVDITRSSRGTTQRTRVIGRGEGKNSDEIASDWQVNAAGIAAVNTFYEKIYSEKSAGIKTQADVLANVLAEIYGAERIEVIVALSYDPWEGTANHYEVGDEVFFTDGTCGFTEEKLRIVAIERRITNEPSNETTLTLATSWYDVADLWAEINRQLRNAGLTGTVIADWRAESGNQDKAESIQMTDVWSQQSKNDDLDPPPETDDDRWQWFGIGDNSQDFFSDKDMFGIKGSKDAGWTRDCRVWLLKEPDLLRVLTLQAGGYVNCVAGDIGKNVLGAVTGDTGTLIGYDNALRKWWVNKAAVGDDFDQIEAVSVVAGVGAGTTTGAAERPTEITGWVDFDQDPRFVVEFKIPVYGTNPSSATEWREDDYFVMGMFAGTTAATGLGFGFRILRTDSGYELYTYLRDSIPPESMVLLATLNTDQKYRVEARVDFEERLVKWYVDNTLTAILPFGGAESGNNTNMFPFNVYFATSNPDPVEYWAHLLIYNYRARAEWEN